MSGVRVVRFRWLDCLAGGVLASVSAARADDCSLVSAAAVAQAKAPHAVTHVMTLPGQPPTRQQMVFTDTAAYRQMNGTWMSTPISAQDQIEAVNEASRRAAQGAHDCKKVASEPLNGEPASLLIMHTEVNGKRNEARIWVSSKSGLPLKSEPHLGNGTVVADDFRYDKVEAPAYAK